MSTLDINLEDLTIEGIDEHILINCGENPSREILAEANTLKALLQSYNDDRTDVMECLERVSHTEKTYYDRLTVLNSYIKDFKEVGG